MKSKWVVAGASLIAVALAWAYPPLDGFDGLLASWLAAKEDTEYARGYSDSAFRKVRVGMTEQEVVFLLGEPLDVFVASQGGQALLGWQYSRSRADASYRVRNVLFLEGRVSVILHEFYLD